MKTIKLSVKSYTILKNFNRRHIVINIIMAKGIGGYGLHFFYYDGEQGQIYNFGIAVLGNVNELYHGD